MSTKIDWDKWRADYDSMTYDQMREFYNNLEKKYPDQNTYSPELSVYLRELPINISNHHKLSVLEIGGWKGELADDVLEETDQIFLWKNLEICPAAVKNPICVNQRYYPECPDDFIWNLNDEFGTRFNILVASHVLEHMKAWQIIRFLKKNHGFDYICMETPHGNWNHYNGSHILDLTKEQLDDLIIGFGYKKIYEKNNVRCFELIESDD